jgi:ABC-type glycerol-3-phosphate transport system substrate-binding protein
MAIRTSIGRFGVTVAAVLTVSACGALTPGSESDQDGEGEPSSVSTELPDEEVTLRVAFTDGPEMVEKLADAFEKQHPQVTVEPQYTQFSDYVKNIKLTMTSDSPPDVAQFAVPMKDLIGTGEVLDLDPYKDAYNWTEKFPPVSLDQLTSDESGKVYGSGNLYAVPAGLSLTGIFYNKQLAEQAGIDVPPATLKDFEQALEQAKQADLTPISVGALDSGGVHLWAALLNVMMPTEDYRAWVNGEPGGSLTTDEAVAATEKVADWAERGYIPESANGAGQAQSTGSFASGDSVFLMNGNWAAAQVATEMGDNAGFFLMPGTSADDPATGSGFSVSYTISSESEHPDVAAAFLDFLGSPEAAEIESNGGFLPPNVEAAPKQSGVQADLYEEYARVIEDDGLNVFPDFAAPSAYDREVSGIQSLIAGEGDPEEFLESVQKVRDDYHAE